MLPILAGGLLLGLAGYELAHNKGLIDKVRNFFRGKPVAPPAPPPPPPGTAYAPKATDLVPTQPKVIPPPKYPGFVGMWSGEQSFKTGSKVQAVYAFTELGSEEAGDINYTPPGMSPLGSASPLNGKPMEFMAVVGTIQGGDSSGWHVKITDSSNATKLPTPSFLAVGGMVTGPSNVWRQTS